jgi:hypothetical protein
MFDQEDNTACMNPRQLERQKRRHSDIEDSLDEFRPCEEDEEDEEQEDSKDGDYEITTAEVNGALLIYSFFFCNILKKPWLILLLLLSLPLQPL